MSVVGVLTQPRRSSVRSVVGRLVAVLSLLALPSAVQAQEVIEYYGTDALGSIRVVFDATGNVVSRADYLPFGEEMFAPGPMPTEHFTGQARDGEAGLDYFNARMYQPRSGRFNTVDPLYEGLFDPQRWNRYAYARNSPTGMIDPTGRSTVSINTGCFQASGAKWCPGVSVTFDPTYLPPEDGQWAGYVPGSEIGMAEEQYIAGDPPQQGPILPQTTDGPIESADLELLTMVSLVQGLVNRITASLIGRAVAADVSEVAVPMWSGTGVPRWFRTTTAAGDLHVSTSATKHLAEYALGRSGANISNHMAGMEAALRQATAGGIKYNQTITSGAWEFIIAPPKAQGYLPAVIHALYRTPK